MSALDSVEKDAPVCRVCYAMTLSKYERIRFWDEPVTACVYLCPEHQSAEDRILATLDWSKIQVAKTDIEGRAFPPGADQ